MIVAEGASPGQVAPVSAPTYSCAPAPVTPSTTVLQLAQLHYSASSPSSRSHSNSPLHSLYLSSCHTVTQSDSHSPAVTAQRTLLSSLRHVRRHTAATGVPRRHTQPLAYTAATRRPLSTKKPPWAGRMEHWSRGSELTNVICTLTKFDFNFFLNLNLT